MTDFLDCLHLKIRSFTFSDGVVIKMCPECNKFDNARRAILRTGKMETINKTEKIRFDVVLNQMRISPDAGLNDKVDYVGLVYDLIQYYQRPTPIKPSMPEDHEHNLRASAFPHTLAMPTLHRYFCCDCVDVVVTPSGEKIRTTNGVYLPKDHPCPKLRVYDLQGNQLEIKPI